MTIASKDIPYVREDRLHKEMSNLNYKRDRLRDQIRREGKDEILISRMLSMETEACYIHRELEFREARRQAHRDFRDKNPRNYREKNSYKKRDNSRDNRAKRKENVV